MGCCQVWGDTMTDLVHRNFIVPKAWRNLASDLCAAFSPSGGRGMFKSEYTTTQGGSVVTDYVSSGPIGQDFADLLPLTTTDAEGVVTTTAGHPEQIVAFAASLEPPITLPLATVQALLAAIDVSDGDPWAAFSRVGIYPVRVPLP